MGERAHFFCSDGGCQGHWIFWNRCVLYSIPKMLPNKPTMTQTDPKKRNTTTFNGMTERKNKKYIKIDQNSDTSSRWGEGDGREPPPLLLSAVWLQLSAVPPPHVRRPDLRARWFVEGPNGWGGFSGTPCRDTHCLMEDLANQLLLVYNLCK